MEHKNVKLAWRFQAAKTIVSSQKVRKGGQDQESIQSSTTPDPEYHNKTSQTRAKRSALSQQVATRQQWTDKTTWQKQKSYTKETPPWNGRLKYFLLEGLNEFHGANLTFSSDVD